jgi:uncharacterized protein
VTPSLLCLALFACSSIWAQQGQQSEPEQIKPNAAGTRDYPTAVVRKGPRFAEIPAAELVRIGNDQRTYLVGLQREGKLLGAGPFTDDSDIRGIYVFNVRTRDEAAVLCSDSPAVKAGRIACEMHMWRVPTSMGGK